MKILHGLLIATFLLAAPAYATTAAPYQSDSSIKVINTAPPSIGNFIYSDSHIYEEKSLGYTLRYRTQSQGLGDVYVYPVPDVLTNQSHSEIVKIMTESAIADIRTLEERGQYQDLNIVEQSYDVVNQKTIGKLYATVKSNGRNTSTALYLTEHKGQLFKIRITEPNSNLTQVKPNWNSFTDTMFKFLITNSK